MRVLRCGRRHNGGPCLFARGFFPTDQRAHLPTVPACLACNHAKSELEHYLAALLPFGGRQAGSAEHLEQMLPPRLAKNGALHRALSEGKEKVWTREPTGIAPTTALPLDGEKLEELFVYITKGLMLHEWQTLVRPDTIVRAASLTSHGEALFALNLARPAAKRISSGAGSGIFAYEGAQGGDSDQVSVWTFRAYGGLKVSDGATECSQWGVVTALP